MPLGPHHLLCVFVTCLSAIACDVSDASEMEADTHEQHSEEKALPLTCEVLAGPNCWGDAVAAATACMPGTMGPVTGDKRSCETRGGATVSFDEPLDADAFLPPTDVQVEVDGTLCVHAYQPEDGTSVLETALGITQTSYNEETGRLRLDCPDGTRYESERFAWLDCDAVGAQEATPALLASHGGDYFSLSISGAGVIANDVICCDEPGGAYCGS